MTLPIRQHLKKGTSVQVYNTLGNLVRSYAVRSATDTYGLKRVKAGTGYIRIVTPERVITRQISKLSVEVSRSKARWRASERSLCCFFHEEENSSILLFIIYESCQ